MILVALGANLPSRFGAPEQTLRAAMTAMEARGLRLAGVSRIWLTAPVPISDQNWYHNAVARVETGMGPEELLQTLQDIENEFGRVRTVRNAPRLLDLDLLAYGAVVMDTPPLTIPHPRMQERAFVLLPLWDIAAEWVHPVSGRTLAQLIDALPPGQEARPL